MRKQILFMLVMICLIANVYRVFPSETQKHKQNRKLKIGSLPVQGYWPISNSILTNADVLTSPFGPRYFSKAPTPNDFYDFHEGIDINANFQSVHAAFDGWIYRVEAYPNNNTASYIILRHVDPFDNSTFYTRSLHLNYTSDLNDLNDLEEFTGHVSPLIDAPFAPQYHVTATKTYLINPIATSGNSGGVPPHLHFEGMVGGTNAAANAINPMRDDSLPYTNSGPPTIQNIILNVNSNPRRLSFRVNTHHQQLDLNRIFVYHGADLVETNFDTRQNTDAPADPNPNNRNSDGRIMANTNLLFSITITITTYNFNSGTNQIMDFAYDLPSGWISNVFSIEARDTQGLTTGLIQVVPTGVKMTETPTPSEFGLVQNFPNPFNPSTTLRFALPKRSQISLAIYDAHGRMVRQLAAQRPYEAGEGELIWDGTNTAGLPVASGAYFYRLTAEGVDNKKLFSQTKKLLLVR